MGIETAAIILAGAAVAGAGASVVQGQQQQNAQKKGLRLQEAAQGQAKQNAISQQIRGEQAQAAANRKTPDVASLLAFEQANPGSLPRPKVDRSKLKLGTPSLLGDA